MNLTEALTPFFEKLKIYPVTFTYAEKTKRYISEPIVVDEDDPSEYFIVIKMFNSVGNVSFGYADGNSFKEIEFLGQVEEKDGSWSII